jgi:hypothetical protein
VFEIVIKKARNLFSRLNFILAYCVKVKEKKKKLKVNATLEPDCEVTSD